MSSLVDARGILLGTSSADAAALAERALWRTISFYGTPLDDLDAAIAADPGWLLPRVMQSAFLLSLTEPSLLVRARQALDDAAALESRAPERERGHFAAVRLLLEGRWHAACQVWDDLLLEHPRDALALHAAHQWDFYRGDASQLRARPARVLPEWDRADPLWPHVMAMHAFGLEECNLYPQAEEAGRRALDADARLPWAIHAVAHVLEMQGRFDEGASWLRHHQPNWGEGNGLGCHLWWHLALFRLEGLDTAGALRVVDNHVSGPALEMTLQRLDAASMLWRLHLLQADLGSRWRELLEGCDLADDSAGYYAFNDLHMVIAMVGAGDLARAEKWVARCAERVMNGDSARGANHAMAREIGLPLMRGVLAFGRGDFDAAVQVIYPVRAIAHRFGGSHAQRDIIDQTLIAACARRCDRSIGRALLNERTVARAQTPLMRHWYEALAKNRQSR